uniref:Uncharacterized protein n=1 Tax=Xiphophorus maculatus TaxID=8083 RepID=A0A3B5REL0_XIPMA
MSWGVRQALIGCISFSVAKACPPTQPASDWLSGIPLQSAATSGSDLLGGSFSANEKQPPGKKHPEKTPTKPSLLPSNPRRVPACLVSWFLCAVQWLLEKVRVFC